MSSTSLPITHARFAAALTDLPLSALHAKISELKNSIAHLEKSNAELEEYVRQENDKDCYEALMENKDVMARMQERIELVKREIVEVRGLPLGPEEGGEKAVENGDGAQGQRQVDEQGEQGGQGQAGTVTQAQSRSQVQQNGAPAASNEEEGVFL